MRPNKVGLQPTQIFSTYFNGTQTTEAGVDSIALIFLRGIFVMLKYSFEQFRKEQFLLNRPQWTDSQHKIVVLFLFLVVSCAVIKEPQNTPQRL